jgi:hypothetical protein
MARYPWGDLNLTPEQRRRYEERLEQWEEVRKNPRNPFIREAGKEKLTRQQFMEKYPYHHQIPQMRCVRDVMDTLEGIMALASENTNASSATKERAALAAEVLGEVVLYTLTTHISREWSEASFARLVTRHFARFGTTPKSLKSLLNIFVTSRQLQPSDESR